MTTATTRSILAGALAVSLLLAAPVAAGAAEATAVSAEALFEGIQIPSSRADLNRSATVGNVILYSQPATGGSALAYTLPGAKPAGGVGGRSRVSNPFTVKGEQWVAIEAPEAAYGTDEASGSLAEPGVAYIRAAAMKDIQMLGDGPVVEPTRPQATPAATQAAKPAAAYTPPTAELDPKALTTIVSKIAAALFAALVIALTLFIYKRPAA